MNALTKKVLGRQIPREFYTYWKCFKVTWATAFKIHFFLHRTQVGSTGIDCYDHCAKANRSHISINFVCFRRNAGKDKACAFFSHLTRSQCCACWNIHGNHLCFYMLMNYFFLTVSTSLENNTFVLNDFQHSNTWQHHCLNPLWHQCEVVKTIYIRAEKRAPKRKNKVAWGEGEGASAHLKELEEPNKTQLPEQLSYLIISCTKDWFVEEVYRFFAHYKHFVKHVTESSVTIYGATKNIKHYCQSYRGKRLSCNQQTGILWQYF